MNMKVANDSFCARKERNYCVIASVANNVVAYGRKKLNIEVLIIGMIKEAWELLLLLGNQVASNYLMENMQV
jgi:hypothetical protein